MALISTLVPASVGAKTQRIPEDAAKPLRPFGPAANQR